MKRSRPKSLLRAGPSMCGKAPLFRQVLKIISRGYAAVDAGEEDLQRRRSRHNLRSTKRKSGAFPLHRAAEPRVIPSLMNSILLSRIEHAFAFAQQQVGALVERDPGFYPLYTDQGKWRHSKPAWTHWCDGFLPGMMWIFYEETEDPKWRELAESYSQKLEPRKDDREVHDLGFIFFMGHTGAGLRLRSGMASATRRSTKW